MIQQIDGIDINGYSNHIHVLNKIVTEKQIKVIIEWGTGFSSSKFLLNHCDKLYSLQMQYQSWFIKVRDTLKPIYGDKFDIKFRLGKDGYNYIHQINQKIDLAFVDGHGDSRPQCINQCFKRKIKYIVTHDTQEKGYGWDRVKMPDNYRKYDFKKYNNWTTLYTSDLEFYKSLINWVY